MLRIKITSIIPAQESASRDIYGGYEIENMEFRAEMSKERLKKLDEEDKKLVHELVIDEELTWYKLLGFRLPEAKCFIPPAPCGHTMAPVMSLVPMYEVVLLPISSHYWPVRPPRQRFCRISKVSVFKWQHGLTPSDLVILAEKGRVIPYFERGYVNYSEKIISPLLQPGVPRISPKQMALIRALPIILMEKERKWADVQRLASQDLQKFSFPHRECVSCLSACYMIGLRKYFESLKFRGWTAACFVSYALSTRVFDAVLQTECKLVKDLLSYIGGLPDGLSIEYILQGLKVNYAPNIPIEAYLDIFDGKASKALRKIVADLLNDPLSRKYTERLSAKIYDLNQQIKELAQGRAAKVFEAISDMALYGGKKFIESKTQQHIKIPKRGFVKLGEWLASQGIDLQAKIQRKDWSIAQLYKARCKLERCK